VFCHQFEAVAEHYKWAPCVKATHLVAALQGWDSNVLHRVNKEAMYEKTTEALKGHSVEQHLATVYHTQLKTRTKIIGESLQGFTTTVEQLAHRAYPAYPRSRFTGKQTRHLSIG
jgi:hypothetical protein